MQFGLGYGLPDNNEDRESSYWRLMVAFPIIFAALHLSILTFILKYDTPTFVYMNTKGNETKTLLKYHRFNCFLGKFLVNFTLKNKHKMN